jgi:hypothetical protein
VEQIKSFAFGQILIRVEDFDLRNKACALKRIRCA